VCEGLAERKEVGLGLRKVFLQRATKGKRQKKRERERERERERGV
jgi:hypothetical protein